MLEAFWYVLTLAGSPYLWAGITGVLFLGFLVLRRARPGKARGVKDFMFILIPALLVTFLLVTGLKSGLGTERACIPCLTEEMSACNPYCPEDASFPSGHAATIFAVFSSLALALGKKKWLVLYIIPVLVGASRMALGVHTWYDVAVGAFIGIGVALLVWKADKKLFG